MAKIKTKEQLRDYILRSLGAPSIRVELTEDQLDDCIDDAIQRFSEYGYDGQRKGTLLVNIEPDKLEYQLPDNVMAVTHMQASSNYNTFLTIPRGYSLAVNPLTLTMMDQVSNIDIQTMTEKVSKLSQLRSVFDVTINYDFNSISKVLTLFEKSPSSVMLLELALEYEPLPVDNIFNHFWIKKRSIGNAFYKWSTVTGKYSTSLVSGAEINYSDLQAKGESIIQETEDELEGLFEPLGLYSF